MVLFDVQNDQRQGIAKLLQSSKIPLHAEVPIVTMRLTAIKGRRVEILRSDAKERIPDWALRREYRSTYRAGLTGTEEIIKGVWQGKVGENVQPIPVSVEKGLAETLKVDVGDDLQFEIQGVPLATRIASLREVEWQRVQPNFFVVFPEGVLESAPQFYAIVARAESTQASAQLQRAVVEQFPNVSVIDLSLVLNTLNQILSRVSYAMRFVALFTILTGIAVLASAVLGSRMQRLRESILLQNPRGAALVGLDLGHRRVSFPRRSRQHRRRRAWHGRQLGFELLLFWRLGRALCDARGNHPGASHRRDGFGRRDGLLGITARPGARNIAGGSVR